MSLIVYTVNPKIMQFSRTGCSSSPQECGSSFSNFGGLNDRNAFDNTVGFKSRVMIRRNHKKDPSSKMNSKVHKNIVSRKNIVSLFILAFGLFGVWEFYNVITGYLNSGLVTPNGDERYISESLAPEVISAARPTFNARQDLLQSIHIPCAIFWTFALVFNFSTGTFRFLLKFHQVVGWIAMLAVFGMYVTGIKQLYGFRLAWVEGYTSITALISSPFFVYDVFFGMWCVTMEKAIVRHKAHMWLALFGTISTGFVASISIEARKFLFPTLAETYWSAVEEVIWPIVKLSCLAPYFVPNWNPHLKLLISIVKQHGFPKKRTYKVMWTISAAVHLAISIHLLQTNLNDLKNALGGISSLLQDEILLSEVLNAVKFSAGPTMSHDWLVEESMWSSPTALITQGMSWTN